MEEYRKFYWFGICLFFLIIPLFILLWKYIKFLIALNEVKQRSPQNDNLNYGFYGLIVGFVLGIIGGVIGYSYDNVTYYISGLEIICLVFAWYKLKEWGNDLYKEKGTGNMVQLEEGFKDIMIAQVLLVLIIGIFLMPGAFGKASRALINEFGSGQYVSQPLSSQQSQAGQFKQPLYGQIQPNKIDQSLYRQPQQPQYAQTQQPPEYVSEKPSICPQCGTPRPNKEIKFCGSCGYKF